jgi:hypothetical protein
VVQQPSEIEGTDQPIRKQINIGFSGQFALLDTSSKLAVIVVIAGRFDGPLNKTVNLVSARATEDTISYRWSQFVQRRAVVITISVTLLLMVVAIPVFSIQLGFADAGNDPEGATTRQAYDLLEEGFGLGANGQRPWNSWATRTGGFLAGSTGYSRGWWLNRTGLWTSFGSPKWPSSPTDVRRTNPS